MSEKHAAKHRSAPTAPLPNRLARRLRGAALLLGLSVAATGLVVSTGVLSKGLPGNGAAAALSASSPAKSLSASALADRERQVSRSSGDRSPEADRSKARVLSNASGAAVTKSVDLSSADPKSLTRALMPQFGMSPSEFGCIDNIWSQESGWNVHAANPSSSAYGIPQALPGSKMASSGPNWQDNAETQIRWGLGYIKSRYGSPCAAWSFKQGAGWY